MLDADALNIVSEDIELLPEYHSSVNFNAPSGRNGQIIKNYGQGSTAKPAADFREFAKNMELRLY